MNQWKLIDLIMKKNIFTDESVKGQITDSISENLTDSDLKSMVAWLYYNIILASYRSSVTKYF